MLSARLRMPQIPKPSRPLPCTKPVPFELAEKIVAASWIQDGAKRLRPFIEIENQRVVRSALFSRQAPLEVLDRSSKTCRLKT
jgi:hypothetical protein